MAAWRFVNNTDIITRLPKVGRYSPLRPRLITQYHPVGELRFIDQDGNIGPAEISPRKRFFVFSYLLAKYRQIFGELADHAPLRYTLRIWNAYSSGGAAAAPAALQTPASRGLRFGFPFKSIAALTVLLITIGLWLWYWPPQAEHTTAHMTVMAPATRDVPPTRGYRARLDDIKRAPADERRACDSITATRPGAK